MEHQNEEVYLGIVAQGETKRVLFSNTQHAAFSLARCFFEWHGDNAKSLLTKEQFEAGRKVLNRCRPDVCVDEKDNARNIKTFWSSKHVKDIWYKRRTDMRRVPHATVFESTVHFMDNVMCWVDEDYTPTKEDCLRMRVRPTGICEGYFNMCSQPLRIIKCSGTRWVICFMVLLA